VSTSLSCCSICSLDEIDQVAEYLIPDINNIILDYLTGLPDFWYIVAYIHAKLNRLEQGQNGVVVDIKV
jgi:hypothetical protein